MNTHIDELRDKLNKKLGLNKENFDRNFKTEEIGQIIYDIYCMLLDSHAETSSRLTTIEGNITNLYKITGEEKPNL